MLCKSHNMLWLFSSQLYDHHRPIAIYIVIALGVWKQSAAQLYIWTFVTDLACNVCFIPWSSQFPILTLTPFYATEYLIHLIFALPALYIVVFPQVNLFFLKTSTNSISQFLPVFPLYLTVHTFSNFLHVYNTRSHNIISKRVNDIQSTSVCCQRY